MSAAAAAEILETVQLGGGLVKEILRRGSGPCPTRGVTVTTHYTGRFLDGRVFDSSVTRGTPFKFGLGMQQVIKGWDVGVASMQVGEKALLTCPPDFAYGSRGAGGIIPPGAVLKFELELLSYA